MKRAARVSRGKKAGAGRSKIIPKIRASATGSSKGWMGNMEELYRPIKRPVTLRLDADVVAWFKADGRGYQTRINRALRKVMLAERKAGE